MPAIQHCSGTCLSDHHLFALRSPCSGSSEGRPTTLFCLSIITTAFLTRHGYHRTRQGDPRVTASALRSHHTDPLHRKRRDCAIRCFAPRSGLHEWHRCRPSRLFERRNAACKHRQRRCTRDARIAVSFSERGDRKERKGAYGRSSCCRRASSSTCSSWLHCRTRTRRSLPSRPRTTISIQHSRRQNPGLRSCTLSRAAWRRKCWRVLTSPRSCGRKCANSRRISATSNDGITNRFASFILLQLLPADHLRRLRHSRRNARHSMTTSNISNHAYNPLPKLASNRCYR